MTKEKYKRLPENWTEYVGNSVMSNFDGKIIQEVADAIKGEPYYSRYAGWNFNGLVWWQDEQWNCEIWCYRRFEETVSFGELKDIMTAVCDKYGHQ